MIATYDFISGADLPGELAAPVDEAVDLTPTVGGCGQALVVAALVLTGGEGQAVTHLEGCPACREALIGVGRIAAGVDALAFFEGLDMETPHAAELAGHAA